MPYRMFRDFANNGLQRCAIRATICVNLMGVDEAYARGGQVDIHRGRFFEDEESRHRMPVAVIEPTWRRGCSRTWIPSERPSWWTAINSR